MSMENTRGTTETLMDASQFKKSDQIFIRCEFLGGRFEEYAVCTTHDEVMSMIEAYRNDKNKTCVKAIQKEGKNFLALCQISGDQVLKMLKNQITKYSEDELNDLYEKKTQDWTNWCNDVVLYACARHVWKNEMIPIIEMKTKFP